MKKSIRIYLGSILLSIFMGSAYAADLSWKLGSPVGPQDLGTKELQRYAERVGEASGGRIEIEVIPIETLGFKNVDSLRVLKQKVVDAVFLQSFYVTRDEPLMGVFMPHGILTDMQENLKVIDVQADIMDEVLKDNWGFTLITNDPTGGGQSRLLVVAKDPINTLDQLRDIKFRHYSKAGLRAFATLGVSTQVIPSAELYLALQTGVVDAAAYGAPYVLSRSLNEVACCSSFVGAYTLTPRGIITDAKAWENVPSDLQKILVDVGKEMTAENMAIWAEEKVYNDARKKLEDLGHRFLDAFPLEDREIISQAILDVWREDTEKLGPDAMKYLERIVAALRG